MFDEYEDAYESRAAGMTYLADEIVTCALDGETLKANNAVWTNDLKFAYCNQEELEADQEMLLSRKFEVEDWILGYDDCNN